MKTSHALRTPLGKVRGLGSAKSGPHHWILQRVTSIALIPLGLWFFFNLILIHNTHQDYGQVVSWIMVPLNGIVVGLFFAISLFHGFLGLQVIIEDYVPHVGVRFALIWSLKASAILLGVLGIGSLLMLYFDQMINPL